MATAKEYLLVGGVIATVVVVALCYGPKTKTSPAFDSASVMVVEARFTNTPTIQRIVVTDKATAFARAWKAQQPTGKFRVCALFPEGNGAYSTEIPLLPPNGECRDVS